MSNIDKQALKELYSKVERQAHSLRGNPREYQVITGLCPVNVIELHAQKILALLDELETKEEQRANWFQMAEKLGADLDAAEKRIAELEARTVAECQHQWRFGGANKLQRQKQCVKCGRVELDADGITVKGE